jgi:hypothetical protein
MNSAVLLWGLFGLMTAALGHIASPTPGDPSATTARVRVLEPELAGLVQEGINRSRTFRRLVQRIDESDGIVYVQTGPCSIGAVAGCLLLGITEAGHARYLRIHVTPQLTRREQRITIIGHELQHANEILSRRWVRNTADAYALFIRIASSASIRSVETDEAQRIEEAIARELAVRPTTDR